MWDYEWNLVSDDELGVRYHTTVVVAKCENMLFYHDKSLILSL